MPTVAVKRDRLFRMLGKTYSQHRSQLPALPEHFLPSTHSTDQSPIALSPCLALS